MERAGRWQEHAEGAASFFPEVEPTTYYNFCVLLAQQNFSTELVSLQFLIKSFNTDECLALFPGSVHLQVVVSEISLNITISFLKDRHAMKTGGEASLGLMPSHLLQNGIQPNLRERMFAVWDLMKS